MKKIWKMYKADEEKIEEISNKYNIGKVLAKIILNRKIEDNFIQKFLYPARTDFYDPFLMPDMEKAVSRIIEAINKKEKVIIFGDYDADGITSITVLKRFLEERGLAADYYIPNRLTEGYGLNKNAIDKIAQENYNLIITVDCGISCIEEVSYANSLNIEVIITDHHEPGEVLPSAIAVVDAKRKDNKYPFTQLAGVGVSFKLIHAISEKLNVESKDYLKYLDIVAVGTISDIVPLIDENRTIAGLGLKLINQTKNIGLKSLLKSINCKVVNATVISFGISPRINACGRMGKEKEAMELFLTENIVEAEQISKKMNEYNQERQEIEKRILEDVLKKVENENEKELCIIVESEDWHHGIIGIVSSKITERFYKPSILVCFEDGVGKASGRSVKDFDLFKIVSSCSQYLENFGGHEMAIGLTVKKENYNEFKKQMQIEMEKSDIKEKIPVIKIDGELELRNITLNLIDELEILEPYGANHSTPVFLIRNLKISSITTLSEGKHLKISANDNEFVINAIGFGKGDLIEDYWVGDKIDIVGNLGVNEYRNSRSIQLVIKDIRPSTTNNN